MKKKSLLSALAAGACVASSAQAGNFEMFVPEGQEDFTERFHAAPAVRAGDFVYISGVVGFIPEGEARTPEAYEAAIRDTFERVAKALEAAGAGWDDVAEMTTFHVDMREHQEIFRTVREEYVAERPYAAWTGIGVEKLWVDSLFVEIRVVAYLGD